MTDYSRPIIDTDVLNNAFIDGNLIKVNKVLYYKQHSSDFYRGFFGNDTYANYLFSLGGYDTNEGVSQQLSDITMIGPDWTSAVFIMSIYNPQTGEDPDALQLWTITGMTGADLRTGTYKWLGKIDKFNASSHYSSGTWAQYDISQLNFSKSGLNLYILTGGQNDSSVERVSIIKIPLSTAWDVSTLDINSLERVEIVSGAATGYSYYSGFSINENEDEITVMAQNSIGLTSPFKVDLYTFDKDDFSNTLTYDSNLFTTSNGNTWSNANIPVEAPTEDSWKNGNLAYWGSGTFSNYASYPSVLGTSTSYREYLPPGISYDDYDTPWRLVRGGFNNTKNAKPDLTYVGKYSRNIPLLKETWTEHTINMPGDNNLDFSDVILHYRKLVTPAVVEDGVVSDFGIVVPLRWPASSGTWASYVPATAFSSIHGSLEGEHMLGYPFKPSDRSSCTMMLPSGRESITEYAINPKEDNVLTIHSSYAGMLSGTYETDSDGTPGWANSPDTTVADLADLAELT